MEVELSNNNSPTSKKKVSFAGPIEKKNEKNELDENSKFNLDKKEDKLPDLDLKKGAGSNLSVNENEDKFFNAVVPFKLKEILNFILLFKKPFKQ